MHLTKTTLLYDAPPRVDSGLLHKLLNQHLSDIKMEFPAATLDFNQNITLSNSSFVIRITHLNTPASSDQFNNSMDSPLSAPFRDVLESALKIQTCQVSVQLDHVEDTPPTVKVDLLGLRILHAITTYLALSKHPLAVHWAQSDQLITGQKYLELSEETMPWALLAKARVFSSGFNAFGKTNFGLELDEAERFIGRPILFHENAQSIETTLAAALGFLRHAIETGTAIPDGQTFGSEGIGPITVAHKAPHRGNQTGMFELSAINNVPLHSPNKSSPFMVELPNDVNLAEEFAIDKRKERTRSLAISYMMLVIMPPVGLLLLIVNLAFGANSNRTGLVASCTIAVLMVVGAFVFLNAPDKNIAALELAPTVSTGTLEN